MDKEKTLDTEVLEYNDIPVFYCKKCNSLRIRVLNDTIDYCDECGSTDIESVHIEKWLKIKFNNV